MAPMNALHEWATSAWCGGCSGIIGEGPPLAETLRYMEGLVGGMKAGTVSPLAAVRFFAWPAEVASAEPCSCPKPIAQPPSEGFHLYRLFAEDNRLLYVGVSRNLRARLRRHQANWGDLIARVEWEEHENAEQMLHAERKAVAEEMPALNKALV